MVVSDIEVADEYFQRSAARLHADRSHVLPISVAPGAAVLVQVAQLEL